MLAGLYLSLARFASAAETQTAKERCDNFKSQFMGAFTWVPDAFCTANGVAYYEIQAFLMLAGMVAIIFIMIGGFWYLTSAGSEEQAEKGRKTLVNAVIGLVVILLAVTIVRIIVNTLGLGR